MPNAEETLASPDNYSQKEELLRFVDSIVCTCNPAVSPDGSNLDDAPLPRTNPHICSHPYSDIHDYQQDLIDLVATCQRHTRCSTSYCLQRQQGNQVCRFGYPKPLQSQTNFTSENGEVEILTARNDTLVNSYNPVQLSAWRGNVDMKYIVSRHKVIEYCAKYATKCEPRSVPLREVFQQIVSSLKDASTSLTAVQKLLMSVIAERDYSSQETCHLLLQLPMFKASKDFVMLSLDGSRAFEHNSEQGQATTTPSILDHYIRRPSNSVFNRMTLLAFAKRYSMPRELSAEPNLRRKEVIVVIRPYYPPDPSGPHYEQYCRQKLMLHVNFRQITELLGEHATYAMAYATFLHSATVPSSLEDDVRRLQEQDNEDAADTELLK